MDEEACYDGGGAFVFGYRVVCCLLGKEKGEVANSGWDGRGAAKGLG